MTPWQLGVVPSAVQGDGKQSSTVRTVAPLDEFVTEADGGDHADVPVCMGTCLDWGCNGQEQPWDSCLTQTSREG